MSAGVKDRVVDYFKQTVRYLWREQTPPGVPHFTLQKWRRCTSAVSAARDTRSGNVNVGPLKRGVGWYQEEGRTPLNPHWRSARGP